MVVLDRATGSEEIVGAGPIAAHVVAVGGNLGLGEEVRCEPEGGDESGEVAVLFDEGVGQLGEGGWVTAVIEIVGQDEIPAVDAALFVHHVEVSLHPGDEGGEVTGTDPGPGGDHPHPDRCRRRWLRRGGARRRGGLCRRTGAVARTGREDRAHEEQGCDDHSDRRAPQRRGPRGRAGCRVHRAGRACGRIVHLHPPCGPERTCPPSLRLTRPHLRDRWSAHAMGPSGLHPGAPRHHADPSAPCRPLGTMQTPRHHAGEDSGRMPLLHGGGLSAVSDDVRIPARTA